MLRVLRAFQIIKRDGVYSVASTYNEIDDLGNITKLNEKDSFIAVDNDLKTHIEAIEQYIMEHRISE